MEMEQSKSEELVHCLLLAGTLIGVQLIHDRSIRPVQLFSTTRMFTSTTREVAELLRVSDATLRRLRQSGVLRAGIHYRAIGIGTQRPPLLWNRESVEETLAKRSRRVLS